MTTARTVLPTDLVAIVARGDRVSPNEAVTRDRIGTDGSQHPLGAALEQWFSFATGRHTWISVKGTTLRGLASARRRGTRAAWEIDCLIFADEDPGIVLNLLDRVTEDAGRAGAEKVFLRLPAGSAALEQATRSGFAAFETERLLARVGRAAAKERRATRDGLRRWGRADAYGTFQLYNRWTPEPVRRMEAATFAEWQAARERVAPPRDTRQAVLELEGRIAGWLRSGVEGDTARFDLMADPGHPEILDIVVDAALARIAGHASAFTLVPEFALGLRDRLLDSGLDEQGEFAVLARRTVTTVRVPELAQVAPVQVIPA